MKWAYFEFQYSLKSNIWFKILIFFFRESWIDKLFTILYYFYHFYMGKMIIKIFSFIAKYTQYWMLHYFSTRDIQIEKFYIKWRGNEQNFMQNISVEQMLCWFQFQRTCYSLHLIEFTQRFSQFSCKSMFHL